MQTTIIAHGQYNALIAREQLLCQQLQDAHQVVHLNIKLGDKLTDERAADMWGRIESVERDLGQVRSQIVLAKQHAPRINPEAASWEATMDMLASLDLTESTDDVEQSELAFV